jgi:glutamyl-Q tRNA(Asp) synthetase
LAFSAHRQLERKPLTKQAVFRFAPSPNGRLHLGHAYSALLNQQMAEAADGIVLLRIENTDLVRCTPVLEQRMLEDLSWLGFSWHGNARRQSEHLDEYASAIEVLAGEGLVYPAFMSRAEVLREIAAHEERTGQSWPRDPDGAPHYPELEREISTEVAKRRIKNNEPHAIRLNMQAALAHVGRDMFWCETGAGPNGQSGKMVAEPEAWGDIVLSGKDNPASYHLACVIDDAVQGVTEIVRGRDLFWSTSVHRLLQELFGFPQPRYCHHDLVLDEDGHKLSKSRNDTSLGELRMAGATPDDIRKMIGFAE